MGVGGLVRGTSFVYKKEKILQIKDLQDFSAEREGRTPHTPYISVFLSVNQKFKNH